MAVALQWHVATNADDPVALATSRSAETGVGEKDVLLVVCDSHQVRGESSRTAAELARSILEAYHVHESMSASGSMTNTSRATSGQRSGDVAHWLSEAVSSGLRQISVTERTYVPAGNAANAPTSSSNGIGNGAPHRSVSPSEFSVIAAVIHHDTLYVARYGSGDAYLLRNGSLQHLTDTSFVGGANVNALEPDLGQLELTGEDRVLLCNQKFGEAVNDTQMRNVLRATPSSRRAAQTLLETAVRDRQDEIMSLAVADYVTGRQGVFPNTPASRANGASATGVRRGTFRSIAAVAALLVLIAGAIFAVTVLNRNGIGVQPQTGSGANGTNGTNGTLINTPVFAPTEIEPINVGVPITPTETVVPTNTPEPTLTPSPSPTNTPEPTLTPTNTPEPTPTETPTRRPTRRPPTATPVPTDTPIPPTPTLGPTDTPTPQPPPPSGGGGGGGGGNPPPPCPPGATCG